MRVALPDFAVSSMNEKFGMLILGNLSGCAYSVRLSVVKSCESRVSLSSNSPSTIGGDYVLVLSRTITPPFCARIKV